MKKILLWLLLQIDIWGTILATKLTYWTKKSDHPIHPKHLVNNSWHHWYLEHILPEDTILDVGCNNGSHTVALSSDSKSVHGFDKNYALLLLAKDELSKSSKINIFLSCGDAETNWPYLDNQFDVVIFLDVLEHLNNRSLALDEIKRVLKPQGRLLLSVPNRNTTWKNSRSCVGLFPYSDPDHKYEYTQDEIELILTSIGFHCMEIKPVVYDTWLSGLIDITGGLSLRLYKQFSQWKRNVAINKPTESTGFRIVAVKNG